MALTKVQTEMAGTGAVLQVVQGTYNVSTSTNSTSFVTTSLTANITPKFSTSKILITISGQVYSSGASVSAYVGVAKNGTVIFNNSGAYNTAGGNSNFANISYLDSPATTSSITYAAYLKSDNASTTVYFNSASLNTSIILMEIAG